MGNRAPASSAVPMAWCRLNSRDEHVPRQSSSCVRLLGPVWSGCSGRCRQYPRQPLLPTQPLKEFRPGRRIRALGPVKSQARRLKLRCAPSSSAGRAEMMIAGGQQRARRQHRSSTERSNFSARRVRAGPATSASANPRLDQAVPRRGRPSWPRPRTPPPPAGGNLD